MDTKVSQISETPKKFIPAQVAAHNAAIDILAKLQVIKGKISEFKKQIANVDADIEIMHEPFIPCSMKYAQALLRSITGRCKFIAGYLNGTRSH